MPDIKQKARNMIGEEIMPTDGKHITIEDYSTYNKGYNYAKREVLRKIDEIIDIAVEERNKEIIEMIEKLPQTKKGEMVYRDIFQNAITDLIKPKLSAEALNIK